MSIGKYLTNFGVISAALGALSTLRDTKQMPRDWRRYLVWVVWGASLALAIGSAAKQPEDEVLSAENKKAEKQAKKAEKQARKAAKASAKALSA